MVGVNAAAKLLAAIAFAANPITAIAQTPPAATQPAARTAGVALSLDDAVRMAEGQSEAVRIARAGIQRASGQQLQAQIGRAHV